MNFVKLVIIINLAVIFLLLSYPLMAWLRSVLFKKINLRTTFFIQPVSIIIACSNEELFITQKIESFMDRDEWIEGSEIIVVSNNSKDATNTILQTYTHHPDVRVFIEEGQSSKIKSVNRGVKEAKHDLLVFSDCRQQMKKGSVKSLIHNFKDPGIGTVNSTLTAPAGEARFSFRALLNFIAHCESASGSSLNVFGALYAQRRSVFREIPTDLLFDDLFVTVSTIAQKYRLVTEKNAVIYDVPFEEYYQENRIRRLARGLLIFLFNHFDMIRQLPATTLIRFMMFKYLKLVLPFALLFLGMLSLFNYKVIEGHPLLIMAPMLIVFAIKPLRRLFIHLLKINYNFMIATIQFLFFNNRSNKWDKLDVSKTIQQ